MDIDYSTLLTPEIMAEMPENLTIQDQLMWKRNKINQIKAQMKRDAASVNGNGSGSVSEKPSAVQPAQPEESVETMTGAVAETNTDAAETAITSELDAMSEEGAAPDSAGEFDIGGQESEENSETVVVHDIKSVTPRARRGKPLEKVPSEDVKALPKSVMTAVRRMFSVSASKSDLISAFVYIFTNGDCEISDAAMEIVRSYSSDNPMVPVNEHLDEMDERFDNLERMCRQMMQTMQSVELCTCYNTFDRRYGSDIKRTRPKDTEFREPGNLDMLARLREQAADQLKIDNAARGREIYNKTKSKNDYK